MVSDICATTQRSEFRSNNPKGKCKWFSPSCTSSFKPATMKPCRRRVLKSRTWLSVLRSSDKRLLQTKWTNEKVSLWWVKRLWRRITKTKSSMLLRCKRYSMLAKFKGSCRRNIKARRCSTSTEHLLSCWVSVQPTTMASSRRSAKTLRKN